MLSFIKNLFGSKPSQVEAEVPYKVEALPAGTEAVMATTEQRYVGENEQGSVYETVPVSIIALGEPPATVVVAAPAKKPAKAKATPKPKAVPKPKAPAKPRAPKAPK